MKKILAFLLAVLVYAFGTLSFTYYFTAKEIGFYAILALLGSMIIFVPAFSFWISFSKQIFKIKK
jgi:hypothetical protein